MPASASARSGLVCFAHLTLAFWAACAQPAELPSTQARWGEAILARTREWYGTAEARRLAERVRQYQSAEGAWPKNTDLTVQPTAKILAGLKEAGLNNTIDNGATTLPMRFLALMAQVTDEARCKESFARGLDYLFAAQYPNGGWPQFYPLRERGYYSRITYNDNAMVNVMFLLRDVAAGKTPYEFVDGARRSKARAAVARGVDCLLKTQIRQDGKLTAWCAQHDEQTLEPAWARNFEPPSLSGAESVGIVRFLLEVEDPTPEICAAIEGAVTWLQRVQIQGLRFRRGVAADGERDGWVEPDPKAGPLWARFYEIGSSRPIFAGRDRKIHYSYAAVERERRAGYAYYGTWAEKLLESDYPRWAARFKRTAKTP